MNQRWFVCLAGAVALLVLPAVASAQPGRGGFGGGGGMMLLNDENVQKELEIVDSQKEKLQALQEKIREEMRAMFQGGGRDIDRDAIREKFEGFQKEMNDVLLPHQRERLKQIEVQSRLRFGSTSNAVGDALELSDDEREKLREKDRELSEEMNKEIAKVREKYRDKLLETLSPEQRAKWKELVGKPIEFAQPQFGGGRGGPGGDGGRRRGGGDN
jgi:Spy/CpxP family protein refolding chaperone